MPEKMNHEKLHDMVVGLSDMADATIDLSRLLTSASTEEEAVLEFCLCNIIT
jgi:hypothetical protein